MFKGGRDVGSREHDNEDVLQGAFMRAIDAGDTVRGVPAFGAMFRHIQAERAHLTRVSGAEWRGIQDALHGVRPTERAYPATDDKHSMRKLGTLNHGTRDTHALAMAIAEDEAQRVHIAETVAYEARALAVLAGDAESFPRVLAEVVMAGATLTEVSEALGLTVDTIKARALAERDSAMASGLDHSEDDEAGARYERDVMLAQHKHAEALRNRRALAERATYLRNHGAVRALVLA